MSTTLKGRLDGLDTKDTHEIARLVRKYDYTIKANGNGKLRFKIKYYAPGDIGIGADGTKGKWRNLVSRDKIDGGKICSGSFELPGLDDENRSMKVIFSRGVGTKGVGYNFTMKPA